MIRSACALAVLALGLLQGSSGGHMLLVEHTRCAEHGEWIHGGGHDRTAGEPVQSDPVSFEHRRTSEEAHEHCAMSAERRDAASRVADASFVALLDGTPYRLLIEPTAFVSSADRFRVAPKTSPPA
jgi:hypothetical protein